MATEEAAKLNEMLRNIPDQSESLANNISQLEDLRDELNEQINAVETALLDVAANRLIAFLAGKALSLEQGYTYRGLWETGIGYTAGETVAFVPDDDGYSGGGGDATSQFTFDSTSSNATHYQCLIDNTSSNVTSPDISPAYWSEVPYDAGPYKVVLGLGFNTTNLTAWSVSIRTYVPPVPPSLVGSYILVPVYSLTVGWDGNTQVSTLVSDWNYGYDLLVKELGTDGTYGLIAQRDNINTAINLLTINKNKTDGGTAVFSGYVP